MFFLIFVHSSMFVFVLDLFFSVYTDIHSIYDVYTRALNFDAFLLCLIRSTVFMITVSFILQCLYLLFIYSTFLLPFIYSTMFIPTISIIH